MKHTRSEKTDPIIALNNGVLLLLKIQPRASRSEIAGLHGEPPRIKIRISAPPVDGEANEELISFLSKKLRVAKRSISILRGQNGHTKDVLCSETTVELVKKALMI